MQTKRIIAAAAFALLSFGPVQGQAVLKCTPQRPAETLARRASPYDSLRIKVGSETALLCYGRPAVNQRRVFGADTAALVEYGKLWRTGANEPTILHIPFHAMIAGIHVTPGSYSIYTVPGASEWEVIVNKSITQWGHEGQYTDAIKKQEVGRAKVKPETLRDLVERMVFRTAPAGQGTDLILEWEKTRIRIPITAMR